MNIFVKFLHILKEKKGFVYTVISPFIHLLFIIIIIKIAFVKLRKIIFTWINLDSSINYDRDC